ncbi:MAG: hypothetical protein PHV34_16800 [Verrucomicrobiae bacterium]|nr:hypothetical protein [Verrucomicrobiae bacterium]
MISWQTVCGDLSQWVKEALSDQPVRVAHLEGVVRRLKDVPESLLIRHGFAGVECAAAAWCHDIGYAAAAHWTGWHPVDGHRWLDSMGAPAVVLDAVLYHGGAFSQAKLRPDAGRLVPYFEAHPCRFPAMVELITACDVTTRHDGGPCTLAERLEGLVVRYGADDLRVRHFCLERPFYQEAVGRFLGAVAC